MCNPYLDIEVAMERALDDRDVVDYGAGRKYAHMPSNSFSLPVDSAYAVTGLVLPEEVDRMVDTLNWTITDIGDAPAVCAEKPPVYMVMEILRNNAWERPIYFAVTIGPDSYVGLQDYFRLEGLAWRLVPRNMVPRGQPWASPKTSCTPTSWRNSNGAAWTPNGRFTDENNRRMATNIRLQLTNLAESFVRSGDPKRGLEAGRRCSRPPPVTMYPSPG